MIEAFVQQFAFQLTFQFDTSPHGRRKYVKALQYAHKYASGSMHPSYVRKSDPVRYLRDYLVASLKEAPRDVEEEPPPDFDD